jgi:hypothetical protein
MDQLPGLPTSLQRLILEWARRGAKWGVVLIAPLVALLIACALALAGGQAKALDWLLFLGIGSLIGATFGAGIVGLAALLTRVVLRRDDALIIRILACLLTVGLNCAVCSGLIPIPE